MGVLCGRLKSGSCIHYGPVKEADASSALLPGNYSPPGGAGFPHPKSSGLSYPEVARRLFVDQSWRNLEAEIATEILPSASGGILYDHPEV